MPEGGSSSDCHLCHIHDHAPGSTLLRTHPLRSSQRSRNPSKSSTTTLHRNGHHHHHHSNGGHHSRDNGTLREADIKSARVASALARLSERSHSLPGSRGSTISRPNEVSVLPDGTPHDHVHRGGDVHSLTRSQREYNNVLSALLDTRVGSLPSNHSSIHREPDLLNALPRTRNTSRASTLSRPQLHHGPGSNLTLAQDTEHDYYTHINRGRYKDESRKQRFNIQTVMLIGCYTMLFVVAIIVGVVLCQQNGWLGFGHGSSDDNSGNLSNSPTRNENPSSMRDLERPPRRRGNGGNWPGPTIDYDYPDDGNPPRINTAGVFPGGTGRGITSSNTPKKENDPLRTVNFEPSTPSDSQGGNSRNRFGLTDRNSGSSNGGSQRAGASNTGQIPPSRNNPNTFRSGKSIIDSQDTLTNDGLNGNGGNLQNQNVNGGQTSNDNPFDNFAPSDNNGNGFRRPVSQGFPNNNHRNGNPNAPATNNNNHSRPNNGNGNTNSGTTGNFNTDGSGGNFNGNSEGNNRNGNGPNLNRGLPRDSSNSGNNRNSHNPQDSFNGGNGNSNGNGRNRGSNGDGTGRPVGHLGSVPDSHTTQNAGNFNSAISNHRNGQHGNFNTGLGVADNNSGRNFPSGSGVRGSDFNSESNLNSGGTFNSDSVGNNGGNRFRDTGNFNTGSIPSRDGNVNSPTGSSSTGSFANNADSFNTGSSNRGSDSSFSGSGNFHSDSASDFSESFSTGSSSRASSNLGDSDSFNGGSSSDTRNMSPGFGGSQNFNSGSRGSQNFNHGSSDSKNFNSNTGNSEGFNTGSDGRGAVNFDNEGSVIGSSSNFNTDSGIRNIENLGNGGSRNSDMAFGSRGAENFENGGSSRVPGNLNTNLDTKNGGNPSSDSGIGNIDVNAGFGGADNFDTGTGGFRNSNSGSMNIGFEGEFAMDTGTRDFDSGVGGMENRPVGNLESEVGNSGNIPMNNFGSDSMNGRGRKNMNFGSGSRNGDNNSENNNGGTFTDMNSNIDMRFSEGDERPLIPVGGMTQQGIRNLGNGDLRRMPNGRKLDFPNMPQNMLSGDMQVTENGGRNVSPSMMEEGPNSHGHHTLVSGMDSSQSPSNDQNGNQQMVEDTGIHAHVSPNAQTKTHNWDVSKSQSNRNSHGNLDSQTSVRTVAGARTVNSAAVGSAVLNGGVGTRQIITNTQPTGFRRLSNQHRNSAGVASADTSTGSTSESSNQATTDRAIFTVQPFGNQVTPLKIMRGFSVQRGEVVAISTIKSSDNDISILQPDHDVVFHITPKAPDAGISLIRHPSQDPGTIGINGPSTGGSVPVSGGEPSLGGGNGVAGRGDPPLGRGDPSLGRGGPSPGRGGPSPGRGGPSPGRIGASPVLRRWEHTDNDGTLSRGLVRKDGSFAFTNCRPSEVCGQNSSTEES